MRCETKPGRDFNSRHRHRHEIIAADIQRAVGTRTDRDVLPQPSAVVIPVKEMVEVLRDDNSGIRPEARENAIRNSRVLRTGVSGDVFLRELFGRTLVVGKIVRLNPDVVLVRVASDGAAELLLLAQEPEAGRDGHRDDFVVPTLSEMGSAMSLSGLKCQSPALRNSETATRAPRRSACRSSSCAPMFVRDKARDVPAVGALVQERDEVSHESEFPLAAFTPAEVERLHQVGELLAVEDHALEDGVDEGRERLGRQAVGLGEALDLLGLLLGLEPLVAGADRGLVEAFPLLE